MVHGSDRPQNLAQLQTDSSQSHAELGDLVNLSASQVSRRIARMQQESSMTPDVIKRTTALPLGMRF